MSFARAAEPIHSILIGDDATLFAAMRAHTGLVHVLLEMRALLRPLRDLNLREARWFVRVLLLYLRQASGLLVAHQNDHFCLSVKLKEPLPTFVMEVVRAPTR